MRHLAVHRLVLSLLVLIGAVAAVGCGADVPVGPTATDSTKAVPGRIAYQPYPIDPGPYWNSVFSDIFTDIFSGDPRQVESGFAKLEQHAPGAANDWFMSWAQQNGGAKADLGELVFTPQNQEPQTTDDDGVTICTQVTIKLEGTVAAGSTFTYDNGGFNVTHTVTEDFTASFEFSLNFEKSAPSGTNVSGSTSTNISHNGPIEWEGEGGTPAIDADVTGSVQIDTVTETKEGEGQ